MNDPTGYDLPEDASKEERTFSFSTHPIRPLHAVVPHLIVMVNGRPIGTIMPEGEEQLRWLVERIKGEVKLPGVDALRKKDNT